MKKTAQILILASAFAFFACKSTPPAGNTDGSASISSPASDDQKYEEYKKEGFVSKDKFVTLLIIPSDTKTADSDIEEQIKNRTLSNMQKYTMDKGKIQTSNLKAALLNIIGESGKLKKLNDDRNSRRIFVFEITKTDLKRIIDGL